MEINIFDTDLQPYRLKLGEIVKNLHDLAAETRDEHLGQTLSELRTSINEPFLFVIVGEVKAGKSSFINALLNTGKEVVKVAPDPCTDTIQQLIYGAKEGEVSINPHLKKIILPVDILRKISIVDTPGTNTISEHHQEITERFIPRSNLIVFVFEAKNPYRQSAWDFFDFIHEDWQKKIIFVLQQSDLMNEEDLVVNMEGVRNYARKKNIPNPIVFAVSAKMKMEGFHDESGFTQLNDYIRENITNLNAYKLKLQSMVSTSRNLHSKLALTLEAMEKQLKADREFRVDIHNTLSDQEERSQRQVDGLIRSMLEDYDRITFESQQDLSEGMGVLALTKKSFISVFNKTESPQTWLKALTRDLEQNLSKSFNNRLNEGIEEIADSIRQMAKIIDLKIQNSQTILRPKQDIFGDISDRRRIVLRELREGFSDFINQTENFVGKEVFPEASNLSPNIAAGSGMAVIGAVLATVTSGVAFDITGGIITTAGLLFAGGTILLKRGKIIGGFKKEIDKGRKQLSTNLDEKLKAYISHIRNKIDSNFAEFDKLLEEEGRHVESLAVQHTFILQNLEKMDEQLKE